MQPKYSTESPRESLLAFMSTTCPAHCTRCHLGFLSKRQFLKTRVIHPLNFKFPLQRIKTLSFSGGKKKKKPSTYFPITSYWKQMNHFNSNFKKQINFGQFQDIKNSAKTVKILAKLLATETRL